MRPTREQETTTVTDSVSDRPIEERMTVAEAKAAGPGLGIYVERTCQLRDGVIRAWTHSSGSTFATLSGPG